MATRKKLEIPVDERTEEMTDAALECRSSGRHTLPTFREMLRLDEKTGHFALEGACLVCGAPYAAEYTMVGETVKRPQYNYKGVEGYLINKTRYAGTGRVARSAARAAYIARIMGKKVSTVTLDAPPRKER